MSPSEGVAQLILICHCEERSDEAISFCGDEIASLLPASRQVARNDRWGALGPHTIIDLRVNKGTEFRVCYTSLPLHVTLSAAKGLSKKVVSGQALSDVTDSSLRSE